MKDENKITYALNHVEDNVYEIDFIKQLAMEVIPETSSDSKNLDQIIGVISLISKNIFKSELLDIHYLAKMDEKKRTEFLISYRTIIVVLESSKIELSFFDDFLKEAEN